MQSSVADAARPQRRWLALAACAVILGAAGVAAWRVFGGGNNSESDYVAALDEANLNSWSTERAAVNAGYAVCERLDGGDPTRGSDADFIAVEHLCPDYSADFRVLEQKQVEGTFTVFDSDEWLLDDEGDPCFPAGGYGDVNSSTQAVVRNSSGDELARAPLGSGEIGLLNGCTFTFELTLTEGEDIYILEVGDRGEISYTWDEISEPDAVALTLGDAFD